MPWMMTIQASLCQRHDFAAVFEWLVESLFGRKEVLMLHVGWTYWHVSWRLLRMLLLLMLRAGWTYWSVAWRRQSLEEEFVDSYDLLLMILLLVLVRVENCVHDPKRLT
jgi:hypothetical protein